MLLPGIIASVRKDANVIKNINTINNAIIAIIRFFFIIHPSSAKS